jgi:hypothetical protein
MTPKPIAVAVAGVYGRTPLTLLSPLWLLIELGAVDKPRPRVGLMYGK